MSTKQVMCRYGRMTIFDNDLVIGRSLQDYGEWMQKEVDFLTGLLDRGSIALDIGAYIGTHTLAFARCVGENGKVYSFEPHSEFFSLLQRNVMDNGLTNVELFQIAVSDNAGYVDLSPVMITEPFNFGGMGLDSSQDPKGNAHQRVPIIMIDQIALEQCSLIKIDTEGMELKVIRGCKETIERLRPIVYAECFSVEVGQEITSFMRSFEYAALLHIPRVFNPENFRGANIHGYEDERNMSLVLVPKENLAAFRERHRFSDELIHVLSADDLVLGLLKVPYYKREILAKTEAARVIGVDFFAIETELKQRIVMQLSCRYQRAIEKLLRPGTRRRHYYELGLSGIRVILNEGWRSFWSKLRQRL